MIFPLLLVALLGYFVLAGIFGVVSRGAPRRARVAGFVAIAAAAPFFVWYGAFGEQFTAGQCYSNAFESVAAAAERSTAPKVLASQIRALPLHGYETECSEVEKAARRLPVRVAP
jgi:hypothetical protein